MHAAGRAHGGSRGGSVRTSVQVLLDRGEIAADHTAPTGYRVIDPDGAWILEGRPGG